MPSATAQTEYRRHIRRKNAGRKARNQRNNAGSTPAFPVHTPEAEQNAAEAAARTAAKAD